MTVKHQANGARAQQMPALPRSLDFAARRAASLGMTSRAAVLRMTGAALRLTVVTMGMMLLSAATAGAQQKIDRQMPLNAMGLLRITNLLGSVRITGWDKDSVSVSGSSSPGAQFYMGGTPVGVKLGVEAERMPGAETADLVIRVPVRARIWVRTADGDVDVTGFSGDLDIAAINSRIRVKGTLKQALLETLSGDVELTASPDYLRIRTGAGRVAWSGSSEDVAITTVSGGITVAGGVVARGRFESVTGDVRFSGSTPPTGSLAFDTHAGDIDVGLAKGVQAHVSAAAISLDLFGSRSTQALGGTPGTSAITIGGKGFSGATVVARSFKGKVVFTQP